MLNLVLRQFQFQFTPLREGRQTHQNYYKQNPEISIHAPA